MKIKSLIKKKVLITGSTRGIGFKIAEKFLEAGADVVITGRSKVDLESAKARLVKVFDSSRVSAFSCDFENLDSVRKLSAKIIELDILICNVGSGAGTTETIPKPEEFKSSFSTNFLSAYNPAHVFLDKLILRKGQIIFISSIVASQLLPAPIPYTVSKSALNAFAKAISRELAPTVRVNLISPGNILFDGGTWAKKLSFNKEQVDNYIKDNVPLNRFGTPEEIASIIIFLTSDKGAFICGSNLIIDGGQISSL
tara:strand:+ start:34 stop:795 length:762 start_codon:yes stop_codon:yes gene_type:complete